MLSGRSLPVFLDKHAATIFKVEDGDSSFLWNVRRLSSS
jgi:hypothetical protein